MSIGSGSVARVRGLLSYQGIELWRHSVVVRWTLQIVSAVVVVVLVAWFGANIGDAVQNREIPYGWGFLDRAYGTPVGHHFLPYESTDSFAYAFGVAAVNTAVVSVVGMMLAMVLGLFLCLARLSGNWLVAKLATIYVDIFRNVPLLVQLFFWFYVILSLPSVREGYVIGGMFINNGGLSLPFPIATGVGAALTWSLLGAGAVAAGYAAFRLLGARELRTGRPSYAVYGGVATAFAVGAVAWFLVSLASGYPPFVMSFPEPQGRFGRLEGGFTAPGALVVLLAGLVLYAASFISEVVRSGIVSIQRGQVESSRALGLSALETVRYVTLPQLLRVMFTPLLGQFLNLTKNSSLAGAVGYADLTNVGKTMTQTAPVVSVFLLVMVAYLAFSLVCSLVGNVYDSRMRWSAAVLPASSWHMPRPMSGGGVFGWLRQNLFGSWIGSLLTVVSAVVALALFGQGLRWVFTGADWGVIGVLGGQLVIGQYNSEAACPGRECFWRPQAALLLFSVLLGMSWGLTGNPLVRRVVLVLVGVVALFAFLPYGFERMGLDVRLLLVAGVPAMLGGWAAARFTGVGVRGVVIYGVASFILSFLIIRGLPGVPGLQPVAAVHWGGLMLNLVLAVAGMLLSFPAGVALALGRRSELSVLRLICVVFIEVFRGIPLLTLLFMSQVLVPLAFPEDFPTNTLIRAGIMITLFSSAYMAENISRGLEAVPPEQGEGARALGLPAWKATLVVSLPQAILRVIPSISGQFINLFKDTTLIFVIGMLDMLEVSRAFIQGNADYSADAKELLVFLGLVFWVFTYTMSYVSLKLEEGVGLGGR